MWSSLKRFFIKLFSSNRKRDRESGESVRSVKKIIQKSPESFSQDEEKAHSDQTSYEKPEIKEIARPNDISQVLKEEGQSQERVVEDSDWLPEEREDSSLESEREIEYLTEEEDVEEDYWDALDDWGEEDTEEPSIEEDTLLEEQIDPDLRVEQIVVDFMSQIDCDPDFEPILLKIFLGKEGEYILDKNTSIRKSPEKERVIRSLIQEYLVTPHQLKLMFSVRKIWYSNEHLWASISFKPIKSKDSYFIRNYRNFSWSVAYQFIEAFPFLSDEVLIEEFLLTRYEKWVTLREIHGVRRYHAFLFYIRDLIKMAEKYGEACYYSLYNSDFWGYKYGQEESGFYIDQFRDLKVLLELDNAEVKSTKMCG